MLELVPLLGLQRELLDLPRGMARFRRYLWLVTDGIEDAVRPPLIAFNPMSRGHVAERLDGLLALGAEAIAARALVEAEGHWAGEVPFRVGLVVIDDVAGGWTDRLLMEMHGLVKVPTASIRRGWIAVALWASEPPSPEGVRRATLEAVARTSLMIQAGAPRTLAEILERERRVAAITGSTGPDLEPEDLAYSREVLAPHLDSDDLPTQFACLFGDEAARARGYRPLGLSPRAGLAVAHACPCW